MEHYTLMFGEMKEPTGCPMRRTSDGKTTICVSMSAIMVMVTSKLSNLCTMLPRQSQGDELPESLATEDQPTSVAAGPRLRQ